jgi:hypothetical protein
MFIERIDANAGFEDFVLSDGCRLLYEIATLLEVLECAYGRANKLTLESNPNVVSTARRVINFQANHDTRTITISDAGYVIVTVGEAKTAVVFKSTGAQAYDQSWVCTIMQAVNTYRKAAPEWKSKDADDAFIAALSPTIIDPYYTPPMTQSTARHNEPSTSGTMLTSRHCMHVACDAARYQSHTAGKDVTGPVTKIMSLIEKALTEVPASNKHAVIKSLCTNLNKMLDPMSDVPDAHQPTTARP